MNCRECGQDLPQEPIPPTAEERLLLVQQHWKTLDARLPAEFTPFGKSKIKELELMGLLCGALTPEDLRTRALELITQSKLF